MARKTNLERNSIRHPNRQIRKYREHLIRLHTLERQVMRDLVYGEEEVVVCCSADDVGCEEERNGQGVGVAEGEGDGELEEDDESNDVFCEGFVTH